ncbi:MULTISPECIES: glutamate 5-kinase [Halomonas]|uniref:Glutamate 5-kinase n=2 Tax=Halomonas TaxID=2745 RepID=A0ABQ0U7L6_9GAMM|nr:MULTISPECIES: glutamate 5-kinase [Halomonas]KGE79366.1 gamma-glutamyl kinase [Halomonas salina]MDR5890479.1 glutamate 5-kinase [Halomonas salina]RAH36851.1 glutamate 5-kinase [Halomonas sp. SL1]WJY06996.1 glutamate 5-kinase [Halomonas halophila]GEK74512.1 glutamate 5-kinase [Halomonas halophila]
MAKGEEVPGRDALKGMRRVVVKIGSALLTNDGRALDEAAIGGWVDQIAALHRRGIEVVLVSSGAVAAGMVRLGWQTRPSEVHALQAAAAVGQNGLTECYEGHFGRHQLTTAQVLLTHDDLSNRKRYLNARSALRTLVELGVVPVVNENDTVVTDEIRFGDNDTLGALVANLIEADALVILTDQEGLFDADPRHDPNASLITEGRADDPRLAAVAGDGGALGRGGMTTKVRAARLAARSGALTVIASGRQPEVLTRLVDGERLGTLLTPDQAPIAARKRWLAGQLQVRGTLTLDAGAVKVLRDSGSSLLPVGVKAIAGRFVRGEMVLCVDEEGRRIAKGLVNYGVDEAQRLIGQPSHRIEAILGYMEAPELIHRDNLVVL